MTDHLSVPTADGRISLTRTRSSSSPLTPSDEVQNQSVARPPRPTHTRSRSYVSPTEPKVIEAVTFPSPAATAASKKTDVSRFHHLHLPGRHHHHNKHSHQTATTDEQKHVPRTHGARHRYTQSESQQYHKKGNSVLTSADSPVTPNSVTSERSNDLLDPNGRTIHRTSLMRIASTRSHHRAHASADTSALGTSHAASGNGKPTMRRRASSDPRSPGSHQYTNSNISTTPTTTMVGLTSTLSNQVTKRPPTKSPIEIQLEHGDALHRMAITSPTQADLTNLETQLQQATTELSARIYGTTRTASDLMRRLDDAQDTLSRTTESLVDTISSFSQLHEQSTQLLANFAKESNHLDHDIRRRISNFRSDINRSRAKKVDELESRGKHVDEKAKDLERRLENCRIIVRNWEEREMNKRKAWRGVWVGVLWGLFLIGIAVLAGIISWRVMDAKKRGGERGVGADVIQAEKELRRMTVENGSWDEDVIGGLGRRGVPENVREVLRDVYQRAGGYPSQSVERKGMDDMDGRKGEVRDGHDDNRLRLLDEL